MELNKMKHLEHFLQRNFRNELYQKSIGRNLKYSFIICVVILVLSYLIACNAHMSKISMKNQRSFTCNIYLCVCVHLSY